MYCIRYIPANFLRRFKAPYLHKLVVSMGNQLIFFFIFVNAIFRKIICKPYSICFAGYLRTEREFNCHYEQIRERGQVYTDWLDEIPLEKWIQAFDGGHRWGHMTTNLVECVNLVLKEARNLPITSIVRVTSSS